MAIITFKSNELKETGQTLSLVAIATQMAIEHNYKILIVSTNFKDSTLENCFWELEKFKDSIINNQVCSGGMLDSGVEGLIRALVSSKTNIEIVKNYSKTILKDRLDILLSPTTENYQEYVKVCGNYPEIIQLASKYYDLVFVDLSSRMQAKEEQDILYISDLIIFNITQRLKNINDFLELKENNEFYKKKNVMLLLGRYDAHSKYNVKNITRYLREKKLILAIPYNTLYFESCSEGKVIDYFLKLKNIDENDRNYYFLEEVNRAKESILIKLRDLQMKI